MARQSKVNILKGCSRDRVLTKSIVRNMSLSFCEGRKVAHAWISKRFERVLITQSITLRQSREKLLECAIGDYTPRADDTDAIAQPFGFLNVVGRENHGRAFNNRAPNYI